jgi:hypothetical protein
MANNPRWERCEGCRLLARTGGRESGGACLLRPGISDVDLFRYREGVIYLDAQISDGAIDPIARRQ